MTKLVGIVALAFSTAVVIGQEGNSRPESSAATTRPGASVAALLDTRLPEASFRDAPLEQVLEWFGAEGGLNVWVRWQMLEADGVQRDQPVTLQARNLRRSQVLWMILGEAGGPGTRLGYAATDDVLLISTREDLSAELVVRVYDVSDQAADVPHFRNAPRVDPARALENIGQTTGGRGGVIEDRQAEPQAEGEDTLERLVDVITSTIEPDSWAVNGGAGTIATWRGKLIVRNSLYVHQLIGGTLGAVRVANE